MSSYETKLGLLYKRFRRKKKQTTATNLHKQMLFAQTGNGYSQWKTVPLFTTVHLIRSRWHGNY